MPRRVHLLWGLPGLFVLLALALLVSPFLLVRGTWFRDWALDHAGLSASLSGQQRLRVERVARLDPGGIALEGIRLETRSAGGWEPWLRVGRLETSWRPGDLLGRRIYLSALLLDSVRVDLARLPKPLFASTESKAKGSSHPLRLPSMRCPSLRVERVQVQGAKGERVSGACEFTGLKHDRGSVEGRLSRAEIAASFDSLSLRLRHGRLKGELVRSFELDSLEISSAGIEGLLRLGWKRPSSNAADSSARLEGELALLRLQPSEVVTLRRIRLPWEKDDDIAGRIVFAGTVPSLRSLNMRAQIDLAGRLFGLGLDRLLVGGVASPDSAQLQDLHLLCEDLQVEGSGRWIRQGARASARLHFSGLDLAAGPVARFAHGLPPSRLAGEIAAEADSLGPRVRIIADLRLEPGDLWNRPIDGFTARARLDPERLLVEDLRTGEPDSPALTLQGSLRRDDEVLEVSGTLRRLSLEDWVMPWLRFPLAGSVSGAFRLTGPVRAPRLEADLGVRQGRVEGILVDTLRVENVSGTLAPLDLDCAVRARRINVYEVALDSLRAGVELGETITAQATAWRDTTRIDLASRVQTGRPAAVLLDSLRIEPGSAPPVRLAGPARIEIDPREVRCDSLRLQSPAGSLAGSGWIRPQPGRPGSEPFSFRLQGQEINGGAVAEYFGLSRDALAGTVGLTLQGTGTVENPEFTFRVEASGAQTFGWFWDRIALSGRGGSLPAAVGGNASGLGEERVSLVCIDSLRAISRGYFGQIPGQERMGPEPPGPPILLSADSLSVALERPWPELLPALADSLLPILGAARLTGALKLEDFPVAPILIPVLAARTHAGPRTTFAQPLDPMVAAIRVDRPMTKKEFSTRPSAIGGRIFLNLRLGGTGASPEATLDLTGRHLRVYQAWADSVVLRASYSDSLLTIQTGDWFMGATRSHAEGRLPLALSTRQQGIRLLPHPAYAAIDLPEIDLSLASLVTSLIQDPAGRLSGRVTFEGVAPRLYPLGDLAVTDGSFRVPGREERFSQVKATLHLDSTGVQIREAKGTLNGTGQVTASGTYKSPKQFDLQAKVRDGPVFETGNYRFIVDADVTARPVADGDTLRPQVTGTVQVQEGLLTVDLAKPPGGLPPVTPWLVDLEIIAPGNIRVSQPAATFDVGEGDLRVSFRWPYWSLGGSLQVLDGTYRIFNRTFTITTGSVEFEDVGLGPRPVLDVEAETELPGPVDTAPTKITIHVKGLPEQLQVTLSDSKGEYTDAQLIEMMSVGQLTSSELGRFSSADPTRQYLSSELVGQIERQLVGQLPYADRVQLQGEFGGATPMWINVRPIAQPQWSLSYAQELAASPGREVSVRYRLSNLLFLNAAAERKQRGTEVPLDTYSLDLKFRIEY